MIDIDALIKKPERCKNNFDVSSQKIKKTAKNLAKLVPKITKVVQNRDFVSTQILSTYTQMIDIQPSIKNIERYKKKIM